MAAYDKLVRELRDAAEVIQHLQYVIRQYNPDDAIFDDEKRAAHPDIARGLRLNAPGAVAVASGMDPVEAWLNDCAAHQEKVDGCQD